MLRTISFHKQVIAFAKASMPYGLRVSGNGDPPLIVSLQTRLSFYALRASRQRK